MSAGAKTKDRRNVMTRLIQIFAAAAVVVLAASAGLAEQKGQMVKGKIASVEGSTVVVDQKSGQAKVRLTAKAMIMTVGTATLADIKPGSFIGVGAMPQADGSQKAVRVMIFPEVQRGTGEGHYPWKAPVAPKGSTMTNATVDTTVSAVDGQVLTVKYKGGTQKIIIGKDAQILANIPGTAADLKSGVAITIPVATPGADGTLETSRVNIGRGGFVP
jgi:hypothetical protein